MPRSTPPPQYYHPDVICNSPDRTPSWRWDRAAFLIMERREFLREHDDEMTGRVVRFMLDGERMEGTPNCGHRDPVIAAAHRLHVDGGDRVVVIQARLLARQSIPEVASLMSVDVDVLVAYHAIYFDVGPLLDKTDWIRREAIGWWREGGPAVLLKHFAYDGGLHALEAAIQHLYPDFRSAKKVSQGTMRSLRRAIKALTKPFKPRNESGEVLSCMKRFIRAKSQRLKTKIASP